MSRVLGRVRKGAKADIAQRLRGRTGNEADIKAEDRTAKQQSGQWTWREDASDVASAARCRWLITKIIPKAVKCIGNVENSELLDMLD